MAEEAAAVESPSVPEETDNVAKKRTERLKRLPKPDRSALEEEIASLSAAMDANQKRIQEIKAIIGDKQEGRKSMSSELQEAKNRLQETANRFKQAVEEKKAWREELAVVDQAREHARAAAKALRDKLPFVKVEQIDEEIRKLEYKMTHTSLSLSEEKKAISQMKDLTKSRDFVKDYNERMEKIDAEESTRVAILEKIKEKDAEINSIKALEQEQRKALAASRDKESTHSADMPSLIEERQAKYEDIKALQKKVKELRAEFKAKEDEFYERERGVRKQEQEDKKARWEAQQVERKKREEIWKARQAENYVPPFTDEIILCDQLISMLQKYAPAASSAPAAEKAEVKAPEGASIIKSKKSKNDELEGWFGGLGSGGKKGKGGKNAAAKDKGQERLSLSLDALQSFENVGVAAPSLVKDVLASIEEIKEKKASFGEKQKEELAKKATEDVAVKEPAEAAPSEKANGVAIEVPEANGEEASEPVKEESDSGVKEAATNMSSPVKTPGKGAKLPVSSEKENQAAVI